MKNTFNYTVKCKNIFEVKNFNIVTYIKCFNLITTFYKFEIDLIDMYKMTSLKVTISRSDKVSYLDMTHVLVKT